MTQWPSRMSERRRRSGQSLPRRGARSDRREEPTTESESDLWRPAEPHTELPAGLPSELLLVDCAGISDQTDLIAGLGTSMRCVMGDRIRAVRALLLLLPIQAGPGTPGDLVDLAGDLEALSESAPPDIRVVVAWYVQSAARLRLARPRDERGVWNAMSLLVGNAWHRELAAHDDDADTAVACRSKRLRAMLDASSNQAVGGARPRSIHRCAERLDPHVVVTLCTHFAGRADVEEARWMGGEGVVAAVRSRMTMPR